MTFALSDKYQHKIKSAKELREILGAAPRADKVIIVTAYSTSCTRDTSGICCTQRAKRAC